MEGAVENSKSKRTRNDYELEVVDDDACHGTTQAKKPRIRWTTDLHEKFLQAIAVIVERKNPYKRFGSSNGFGESQVVPKEILEEMRRMGVKGLSRHQVSSHLQKHRSTRTEIKGGELLDQPQSKNVAPTPSYFYVPVMDYPMQQPLPVAFHQQTILNPGRFNVGVGAAPTKLQFVRPHPNCFGSQNHPMMFPGPHPVNQLGFSAWTYPPEFISTSPYSSASPPSLSSVDYQSPEAAPKIIKPEVNFPLQHARVGPDTTTAATNDRSSIGNSEAPATLCDQDTTGLLGLDGVDLFWLEDLIGEENDLN